MKIFLTEHFVSNEVGRVCKMCGPRIKAENLEEAEIQAEKLGITVVGEFVSEEDWPEGGDFCDRVQKERDEAWLKDQE